MDSRNEVTPWFFLSFSFLIDFALIYDWIFKSSSNP